MPIRTVIMYLSLAIFLMTYAAMMQIWVHATNVRVDKMLKDQ